MLLLITAMGWLEALERWELFATCVAYWVGVSYLFKKWSDKKKRAAEAMMDRTCTASDFVYVMRMYRGYIITFTNDEYALEFARRNNGVQILRRYK
jgi:hypothetical protein